MKKGKGVSKNVVYKRVMVFATILLFVAGALTPIIQKADATDDFDWAWSNGSGTTGDLYRTGNVSIGTSNTEANFKALIQGDPKGLYAKTSDNTYEAIVGQCHHNYRPAGFVLENRYPASASFPKGVMMRFKGMDTNGVMQEYLAFIAEYVTRTAGAIDGDCWIRPVKNGGANWAFRFTHDGKLLIKDGGVATDVPSATLDVHGGLLCQGSDGSTPVSGGGQRLMWIPLKAAFRTGRVYSNQWDDVNIGRYSVAMGLDTTASGWASTAIGCGTNASGWYATAMGYYTNASGDYATAMDYYTNASGDYATAMGVYTIASGLCSTAMGAETWASGLCSTAMGAETIASGLCSTAMGADTVASGGVSTAMGCGSVASGENSTAMGYNTLANNYYATAMGKSTIASGWYSTAMGYETEASDHTATAMGYNTTASGRFSTAMGHSTTASGNYSTAMGRKIVVSGENSVGIGMDNTAYYVSNNNVMAIMGGSVGIGTTSPDTRFEIEWNENADIELGRGVFDTDITFLTLRSPDGSKWYLYPDNSGNLVVTNLYP